MSGCVVNVATGRFVEGQKRLRDAISGPAFVCWTNAVPGGSPTHAEVPYAFKAWALMAAACLGHDLLLWADASILPVAPLGPLFERIASDGYWFADNGWINGQWCSDSSLPLLGITREESFQQKHVVATAFGINLKSAIGSKFLSEYMRLAANGSFRGPWTNEFGQASRDRRVLGHRHDQSAASVIAHRLGMKLTCSPEIFAYKGGETESTILLADGDY